VVTTAVGAQKKQSKVVAILLAFVAAGAFFAAAFGPRWLTTDDGDAGIGLRAAEVCYRNECNEMSLYEMVEYVDKQIALVKETNKKLPPKEQMPLPRPIWGGWPTVAMITLIASLLAAAGLIWGAATAIAGKRPILPIMPTTLAVLGTLIALVNGCIFIATQPGDSQSGFAVGWTFLTFGGAVIVSLAAVFPLNKAIRPIDEELGEASATHSWGADLNG